jgi:hypothetical protein
VAENLLNLEVAGQARIALATLGPEDRRLIESWFVHFRNWRNDDFIRSHSRRLNAPEELYLFQTSTDLAIAFEIAGDKVIVQSIFRKEAIRPFEAMTERAAP